MTLGSCPTWVELAARAVQPSKVVEPKGAACDGRLGQDGGGKGEQGHTQLNSTPTHNRTAPGVPTTSFWLHSKAHL